MLCLGRIPSYSDGTMEKRSNRDQNLSNDSRRDLFESKLAPFVKHCLVQRISKRKRTKERRDRG